MEYLRVQLKVCEGCGGLWFRSQSTEDVYGRCCAGKLAQHAKAVVMAVMAEAALIVPVVVPVMPVVSRRQAAGLADRDGIGGRIGEAFIVRHGNGHAPVSGLRIGRG